MATMQELETALVNADRAGDTEAAQTIAGEITRQRSMPAAPSMSSAAAAPASPTLDQKIRGSFAGGYIKATRDPIDAGAQMLRRAVPDRIGAIVDDFGNFLADLGLPVAYSSGVEGVDRLVARDEQEHQTARLATAPIDPATGQPDPGVDWGRVVGSIANPVNLTAGRLLPIASRMGFAGKAITGAAAGAAGGALQPVTEIGPDQSFAATKAAQTGLGLATGAVLTPALSKLGDVIARNVSRFAGTAGGAKAAANADAVLAQSLQDAGQSIEGVPPPVLQSLRKQVADAPRRGQKLDAAALLRKADADAVGVKLTQGQLTRDPNQFAAERNLRGVAGAGEPLLQRFEQQNQRLTGILDDDLGAGRAAEAYPAGQQISSALKTADDAMRQNVSGLYQTARGSAAARSELNLTGLSQDYANILRDYGTKNVPAPVASRLEQMGLLSGTQRKVVTVADAEDVLQVINKNRSNGPAINNALGEIRDAIKRAVTTADVDGGPYSVARQAAATRFRLHDAIPALKAAADDEVAADDFVRKFVLGAKTNEAKELAAMLSRADPGAFQEARNQIGAALARSALGENVTGDRVLSPERLNRAIRTMGTDKLKAFFAPEEVNKIQALGRVAAYINAVPTTAPVNTSNTASTLFNLMRSIPGMPSALAIGSQVVSPVRNSRVVSNALSEQVPNVSADLPPEVLRLLGPLTTAGGIASGGLAAAPLR
ncbi:MAG: hypothetical protein GEV05_27180 [Betaproteobacteria bacterium]|nr:hypothetical protein [Betaproteobacteria bacterium]